MPLITIGMPVYNAAKTLRAAIDSLLTQTFTDFVLVISDNASTDGTGLICREYALLDERIHYLKQSNNIGAEENFRVVFNAANSQYFMWVAADDVRSKDFLDSNLTFLINNPLYVGSTSPVRFKGEEFDELVMGDAPLEDEDPYKRLQKFFRGWHANGRFYSLFRHEALRNTVTQDNFFLGGDWSLVARLVLEGKFNRTQAGWVELGKEGLSHSANIFTKYRQGWIDFVFPFYRLTIEIIKLIEHAHVKQKWLIISRLIRLNLKACSLQLKMAFQSERDTD